MVLVKGPAQTAVAMEMVVRLDGLLFSVAVLLLLSFL